jgi:hypothetical protein
MMNYITTTKCQSCPKRGTCAGGPCQSLGACGCTSLGATAGGNLGALAIVGAVAFIAYLKMKPKKRSNPRRRALRRRRRR